MIIQYRHNLIILSLHEDHLIIHGQYMGYLIPEKAIYDFDCWFWRD